MRGTKSVNGEWGAYLWVLQNRIVFKSSETNWWVSPSNGVPVEITNVMVGSLGDYQATSNVVDIGPKIPTNYPGANQNNSGTYQVDISNVFYQLSIPDIWITPRDAVAGIGGSNVQYTVAGTNIPQGVTWSLIPDLSGSGGATIQSNGAWQAEVTPGNVGTNYTVRATSVDNTNFYDQVSLTVCKIEVTNIKFNHNTGSSANDGINIRQDSNTAYDISNGEWVKDGTNIPVCYTTNKVVTIKARLITTPAANLAADIWAVSTDAGGSLGDVVKTNVTFVSGVANDAMFQISGATPNCVKKTTTDIWEWKMENVNGSGSAVCALNTSGVHAVYTILNEPVSPWVNTAGNALNVWTRILNKSCLWANGCVTGAQVLSNIVAQSYSMAGVEYDGAEHYTRNNSYTEFHLQELLDAMDLPGIDQMDCRGFANWTHTLSGSVGESAQYRVIDRTTSPYYFTYNYILPSGHSDWSTDNWSFHQVGWWNSQICDASLKLDNDSDPTQGPGNSNHVEKLSVGDMTQTDYLDKLTETPDVTDIETGTCVLQ